MASIDVTKFIQTCSMRDFSASVAEIGIDAGPATWRASLEESEEFDFLPTPELLQEFREWLKPCGGWSDDEIAAMSDQHLRALCLQWIAGDWRECFDCPIDAVDWADYETRASEGTCPSSFYRTEDGLIFWEMEH
jgi:hypothetical protein